MPTQKRRPPRRSTNWLRWEGRLKGACSLSRYLYLINFLLKTDSELFNRKTIERERRRERNIPWSPPCIFSVLKKKKTTSKNGRLSYKLELACALDSLAPYTAHVDLPRKMGGHSFALEPSCSVGHLPARKNTTFYDDNMATTSAELRRGHVSKAGLYVTWLSDLTKFSSAHVMVRINQRPHLVAAFEKLGKAEHLDQQTHERAKQTCQEEASFGRK